jgi:hypothetical protein
MSQSQQLADCYQDLFNHLAQEYDLRLTESELNEVVKIGLATVKKINALAEKPNELVNEDDTAESDFYFDEDGNPDFCACDNCDLPDACADYGCAIKSGIRQLAW